jgi:hypothetical protein
MTVSEPSPAWLGRPAKACQASGATVAQPVAQPSATAAAWRSRRRGAAAVIAAAVA